MKTIEHLAGTEGETGAQALPFYVDWHGTTPKIAIFKRGRGLMATMEAGYGQTRCEDAQTIKDALNSHAANLARIAELEAALYECMTDPGALAYRTHSYAKKRIQFINGIVHTALKDADTVAIATNALKGTK